LPVVSGRDFSHLAAAREILRHLAAVKLLEQRQTLLVVTGIAAQGGERIWREGDEIGDRQPPRHIFDIRVEAAIFVDDEDRG
jgi:hypothetical protein